MFAAKIRVFGRIVLKVIAVTADTAVAVSPNFKLGLFPLRSWSGHLKAIANPGHKAHCRDASSALIS
jgi:hypothetical protein